MTQRNRAWRRRKTRGMMEQFTETKRWLQRSLEKVGGKKALKAARPGKLTRVQQMRLNASLIQESFDGLNSA